jgi:hypothetical protein
MASRSRSCDLRASTVAASASARMRATSSAPLRFVSSFSGFDRILGIDTLVRILRF